MKKISFWAACIAAIMSIVSCSREVDELKQLSPAYKTTVCVNESSTFRFGDGGDDDKPIIMHFVRNEHNEPLENAHVLMISNSDSVRSITNSAGESVLQLPHTGMWQLKITLAGFSPLTSGLNVTDSFSVKTNIMQEQ